MAESKQSTRAKAQPEKASGHTGNEPTGVWNVFKERWLIAAAVLVVLAVAGLAAYFLYNARNRERVAAGSECVIRVNIETKMGAQVVKLKPEDNSLSRAVFDPNTTIKSIEIEGCGGRH